MKKQFTVLNKAIVYPGYFRMEKYRLTHTLFNGGWSEEISREVFLRGDCVAVLLYDPHADKVVLIEQFRAGAILKPEAPWLIEIVAGGIEAGETAEEVAYREAREEAGCEIKQLTKISQFYTTPGCSAEWLTLFCGEVDSQHVGGIHGLAHEHEDILVHVVDFDTAYAMIAEGKIISSMPIIALQWLALNKQQLRQLWHPIIS
jgi:ADP-ribose pyrophosphatase